MTKDQKLEDSGERRTFSTGAVRDRGDLKPRPDLISPHAQMREGMIHTLGSQKYALRNWEQGMPISVCLASAQRHIEDYKLGKTNEDHLAQARWNLGAALHYEEEIKAGRMDPSLDDMPKYAERPDWESEDGRGVVLPETEPCETGDIEEVEEILCGDCGRHLTLPMDPYVDIRCPICGWIQPQGSTYRKQKRDYDCIEGEAWEVPASPVAPLAPDPIVPPLPTINGQSVFAASAESPTFYVAGPMRGYKDFNFPAFDEAAKRGRQMGYRIISPADMDRECGIDPVNKPGSGETAERHIKDIIRRDIEAIMSLDPEHGDGIAVLEGWWDSTGATAEVALARWLGLKVVWAIGFRTEVE